MEKISSFEKDLSQTRDISKSMKNAGITAEDLQRWYSKQMIRFRQDIVNDSFILYNELLMDEYFTLKRDAVSESVIRKRLNITDDKIAFFKRLNDEFEATLSQIKRELIKDCIQNGLSRAEIVEKLELTHTEYDDIIKVSEFNRDELSEIRHEKLEGKKSDILKYLENSDIEKSCELSKITSDEFFMLYDEDIESDFYKSATEIFMRRFLEFRLEGNTRDESIEKVGLDAIYLHRWLNQSRYEDFQKRDLDVTLQIVLQGFRNGLRKVKIAQIAEIDINALNGFLKKHESLVYRDLIDYYENTVVLNYLEKILSSKSIKDAIKASDLSKSEVEHYYNLGLRGDVRYSRFSDEFLKMKKRVYVENILAGKSHKIALKESFLTGAEYKKCQGELDDEILISKISTVENLISQGKNSTFAAHAAGVSVDEIYEWYFRGKKNDSRFRDFYIFFEDTYINPRLEYVQDLLDNKDSSKNLLTRRDLEIWLEHDMIKNKTVTLDRK